MTQATNTPEFKKFVFTQNKQRKDIYDLQGERDPRLFHYFRISTPRKPFLIRQGATFVVESWKGHEKTSFTGLIPVGIPKYYFGDLALKTSGKQGKKSMIITMHESEVITLFLFPGFTVYPKIRLEFLKQFIEITTK